MRVIAFFLSLLFANFNHSIAQVETIVPNRKIKKNIAKLQFTNTSSTTKGVNNPETSKAKPKNVEIPSSPYVYKLRNRQLKSKFWYNPNEHTQPIDFYIEKGWTVVKIKKLEQPPLMEKLVAFSQVLIPIVKDNLAKKKDSKE